jgi:hypothetical protein
MLEGLWSSTTVKYKTRWGGGGGEELLPLTLTLPPPKTPPGQCSRV